MAVKWVEIEGVRYDVTNFIQKHPGGPELLESYLSMDATDVFTEFHGPAAKVLLKSLSVIPSDGKPTQEPTALQRDVRALHKELLEEGRFTASSAYYAGKLLELLAFGIAACVLLARGWWYTSIMIMGLFFQQAGWLSHDLAHNQVTRRWRSTILFFTAGMAQGFTPIWWITKHMTHHALPNALHEETGQPVDEDFDTAPFLYWTERMLPTSMSTLARFVVSFQGYYMWVVLLFAKLSWDAASIRVAMNKAAWGQITSVAIHYVMFTAVSYFFNKTLLDAALYWIACRFVGGFLIGLVTIQSHNGMAYYDRPEMGFFEAQILTTRNMDLGGISTWFTGGLNYQIEHHLFPRLPRHHLPHVSGRVRKLCERHDLPYTVMGIWESSRFLTGYLCRLVKTKQA
jgi:fatty acid desaturase